MLCKPTTREIKGEFFDIVTKCGEEGEAASEVINVDAGASEDSRVSMPDGILADAKVGRNSITSK